jgi:hypothetical protein
MDPMNDGDQQNQQAKLPRVQAQQYGIEYTNKIATQNHKNNTTLCCKGVMIWLITRSIARAENHPMSIVFTCRSVQRNQTSVV